MPCHRVIAPDLPGFGFTEVPPGQKYVYKFDQLALTIEAFARTLRLDRYAIYVFDYGAPAGFRLAMAHPEKITAIISQNGNAHEKGLGDAWAPIRKYWSAPTPENRDILRKSVLTEGGTRWQYTHGVANPESVPPESYTLDMALLERPGNKEIQFDLFLDDASNVKLYPQFQDEEQTVERRAFLSAVTAASLGALSEKSFSRYPESQSAAQTSSTAANEAPFETAEVEVAGNSIYLRRYGKGPAILMVHGFPRTSLMWRFLAPKLAGTHTVICVDLRAYGRSGIPASAGDHFPYSKRAMAGELVNVMAKLGFPTFTVIGHDRGGRVSYRLALDHPRNVERLAVFDVIPILEGWSRSDARFARTYWPWILLSQQQPLPESYLLGAPEAVFHNPFGQGSFGREVLDEYVSNYRDPARVHGICEEYRAAATIDVEHDRADKEASKRIECPMLHLWAEGGPLDTFYAKDGGPLGIWRQWAPRAQGQAMKGGHFFPEENPDDTAVLVKQFLSA